jgi:hypothetical protein
MITALSWVGTLFVVAGAVAGTFAQGIYAPSVVTPYYIRPMCALWGDSKRTRCNRTTFNATKPYWIPT